ncbi:hypothetical protein BP5796_08926 [Coleophoma crateriformis]|uniref:Uncharacterized protein n=1 Tax=Coleophoma crateriformis TaxID=565419 RepID=A0A3D8R2K9_9HELO|nr:hypothetical protein BP5796_08926 [Coleophoma crateriformis]
MRVIERLWGSRKFASFLVLSYALTSLLPPMILALVLRPLSFNNLNYLPAGPTPLLFALLAQYHATIPHIYKYRLATNNASETQTGPNTPFVGLTFSDKSYVYLPAVQLSLSQFPGSLLCAAVGWVVGYSWRNEVLPMRFLAWRVPGWMVGAREVKQAEAFEGLRRRLEGEGGAAATGSDGRLGAEGGRRRTLGRQLIDQFRGAF